MTSEGTPAGHEILYLASVMLPHVDKNASKLRWKGSLPMYHFVELLKPFVVSLMTTGKMDGVLPPELDQSRRKNKHAYEIGSVGSLIPVAATRSFTSFAEQMKIFDDQAHPNDDAPQVLKNFKAFAKVRDPTANESVGAKHEVDDEGEMQPDGSRRASIRKSILSSIFNESASRRFSLSGSDDGDIVESQLMTRLKMKKESDRRKNSMRRKRQASITVEPSPADLPAEKKEKKKKRQPKVNSDLGTDIEIKINSSEEEDDDDDDEDGFKRQPPEFIQAGRILKTLFLTADEDGSDSLSWLEFTQYMVDSAIVSSAQKSGTDVLFFVPAKRGEYRVPCTYSTTMQGGRTLMVHQNNVATNPEIKVLAKGSVDVSVASGNIQYIVTSMCLIPQSHIIVCCCELAVLFLDSRSFREVGRLGIDILEDTCRCAAYFPAENVVYAGCRSGRLVRFTFPLWVPRTASWTEPVLQKTYKVCPGEAVLSLQWGATSGLLFTLSTKGTLTCFDTAHEKVQWTGDCSNYDLSLCTAMVFNPATNYLICCGECHQLLAWVGRNVGGQTPMKIEDNCSPHVGRVMGLTSDERTGMLASVDNHGIIKVWDLNTLRCTQTLRAFMSQVDYVALLRQPGSLVLVMRRSVQTFQVDGEALNTPCNFLLANPKGGSMYAAIGRDVYEWNSVTGTKLQHLQSLVEHDIQSIIVPENSASIFILLKTGEVSSHTSTTGKKLSVWEKSIINKEPVTFIFCRETKRIIIPTVGPDVWFYPSIQSDAQEPIKCSLTDGDTHCTCMALGTIDRSTFYFVGTEQNSVQVITMRSNSTAKVVHRINPPHHSHPQQACTAILFADHSLITCDTAGTIRCFLVNSMKMSSDYKITEEIDQRTGLWTHRYATCLINYSLVGNFFLAGDDLGFVQIFFFGKMTAPVPVKEWRAAREPILQIALDQELLYVTTESPNVTVWSLNGVKLSIIWGPHQDIAHDLTQSATERPDWFTELEEQLMSSTNSGDRLAGNVSGLVAANKAANWFLSKKKREDSEDAEGVSRVSLLAGAKVGFDNAAILGALNMEAIMDDTDQGRGVNLAEKAEHEFAEVENEHADQQNNKPHGHGAKLPPIYRDGVMKKGAKEVAFASNSKAGAFENLAEEGTEMAGSLRTKSSLKDAELANSNIRSEVDRERTTTRREEQTIRAKASTTSQELLVRSPLSERELPPLEWKATDGVPDKRQHGSTLPPRELMCISHCLGQPVLKQAQLDEFFNPREDKDNILSMMTSMESSTSPGGSPLIGVGGSRFRSSGFAGSPAGAKSRPSASANHKTGVLKGVTERGFHSPSIDSSDHRPSVGRSFTPDLRPKHKLRMGGSSGTVIARTPEPR